MKADKPSVRTRSRRGSTLIEFALLGIPAIFLCISVVSVSIDMWQFFTLSYAVAETARYAALHGSTCSQGTNSCTITRANLASFFEGQSIALAAASTTMTLNDGSGAVTCNPVSSCPSSSSRFPAVGNNTPVTNNVTVTASYALTNPIVMFWPAAANPGSRASSFTVKATSTQEILF